MGRRRTHPVHPLGRTGRTRAVPLVIFVVVGVEPARFVHVDDYADGPVGIDNVDLFSDVVAADVDATLGIDSFLFDSLRGNKPFNGQGVPPYDV